MRFFTRSWTRGDLPDEQAATVPESYWRHIADLRLPPPVEALARLNPHDAHVLAVEDQPERLRLTLRLRCGDLQRGYSTVLVVLSEVDIDPDSLDTLRRAVRPARVEVLYDEVDRADDGYVYRLLFYPDGEASIRFREVEVTES